MTKDERAHMSKVAALGCVVCRNLGYGETPAALHHIRAGQGMSQRASHYQVLPLCGAHHQTGGYGVAIHCGQKEWESRYGTELELLEQVYDEIGFRPERD